MKSKRFKVNIYQFIIFDSIREKTTNLLVSHIIYIYILVYYVIQFYFEIPIPLSNFLRFVLFPLGKQFNLIDVQVKVHFDRSSYVYRHTSTRSIESRAVRKNRRKRKNSAGDGRREFRILDNFEPPRRSPRRGSRAGGE